MLVTYNTLTAYLAPSHNHDHRYVASIANFHTLKFESEYQVICLGILYLLPSYEFTRQGEDDFTGTDY